MAVPGPDDDASLASAEDEAAKLEDDGDYAAFCQSTANRLYGEGEYGQAVAWYTRLARYNASFGVSSSSSRSSRCASWRRC